jgi:16S rRNA (guanine1207-N2)-methyltransferase
VWALDVNERAVDLCRANAAALGATGVRASVVTAERPDGDVPPEIALDLIWSNPPIRIGKAALHALLTRWLDRLTPTGRAWLVVQRNLGADSLQRWLDGRGWPTERASSRAGYRLLAVGPREGTPDPPPDGPGLRGPNAEGGLRGPNAEGGLRGPNAEGGLCGPNAGTGT